MFKVGDKVKVVDVEKVKNDDLLEDHALKIIQKNDFMGEVTEIMDDIYLVGFKNELGWVTQGFKADEIQEVK